MWYPGSCVVLDCTDSWSLPSFLLLNWVCLSVVLYECNSSHSLISSPEPKALGELIGWDSSRCPSVRLFTLSDMNISDTSWPIIIKFHLKHHWGGGLAALGFGPDRIRTLVSMATDSSHRVIVCLIWFFTSHQQSFSYIGTGLPWLNQY